MLFDLGTGLFGPLPDFIWWLPAVAFALDLRFGDPAFPPHPVRGLGNILNMLEKPAREWCGERVGGIGAVFVLCGVTALLVEALLALPVGLSLLAGVYLSWSGLALGSLLRECRKALGVIESGDVEAARRAVGMLVSRRTENMDRRDLCRSLAETMSENFNDAFVAPFFWLCVGGPVGLWMYKAVSTVDSMWGYKTPRWRRLGWFGARLDDALAFIPARLSVVFLYLAGMFSGMGAWPGFATVRRQAGTMSSPNAGWPMSAVAWIVGASMGGPTPYEEGLVDKPTLGPADLAWTPEQLHRLTSMVRTAGIIGACILWGVSVCIFFLL